uniref:Radial spoke protein 16 n=1 Tax=Chlamydomonas reinhardtii TaxID=3055 RepID=Q5MJ90_CHLRE|nr:radial spoke protein 16 [Chlamydomonas reinhardtii]
MTRGLDYYEVMGLTRSANDIDIRRAYRRLALKYHPDINKDGAAGDEFLRICEAYEVLCDPKTKGFYDLYGEDALKDGISDGNGGLKGPMYRFNPEESPKAVFERFFGTANPYEALEALSNQFESMTSEEAPARGKNKVYPLELTLEEIFHGCLKKVAHKRKVLLFSGEYVEEERQLTVDVKPGLPTGTRFVFEGEGNKTPKKEPGPVVFVLKPKPHPRFVRRGSDLVHKVTLPLHHALIGTTLDIRTLDDRDLKVPISDIMRPGSSLTVPGEGMPLPATPSARGNLVIEIDLLFPTHLTETQKMLLRSAFFLPPPTEQNEETKKALRDYEAAFKHDLKGWAPVFKR